MIKKVLKGITWDHSRGITPLLAAAQRFNELQPDIEIQWKKRSLQEFADSPLEKLTEHYDLLIIDHPWVGCAAATECVLPLDQYLPAQYLNDQLTYSIGNSHLSYNYNGHQWALAIDAATPVSSYRKDLIDKNGASLPTTWEELLQMAKQQKIAIPAIPIDLLMNFYMFCIAYGHEPFQNGEEVIDFDTGVNALATMKELYSLVNQQMFSCNPIRVAELMTKTDDYWYCPFAYCYSNYSRTGFAENILLYTDMVTFKQQQLRSTIGGTGISVSAFSNEKEIAIQFVRMVTSGTFQSTFYVEHGGQPAHRRAWEDKKANELTKNFFSNILPVMERGYTRPRYNGYLKFQDGAGDFIHEFLLKGGKPEVVLVKINNIYKKTKPIKYKLQQNL
jgi:multiple sugar transport system substrate-binding protein